MSAAREADLLSTVDGLYQGLGEGAPLVEGDAATIALYEAARTVGEAALAWRQRLPGPGAPPRAVVVEVLADAVRGDRSGRLALAAMTNLVGPRVLVSLRDARADLDEAAREVADATSDAVVAAIWRCARGAEVLGAGDDAVADGFRDLARRLDDEGYGESFR